MKVEIGFVESQDLIKASVGGVVRKGVLDVRFNHAHESRAESDGSVPVVV